MHSIPNKKIYFFIQKFKLYYPESLQLYKYTRQLHVFFNKLLDTQSWITTFFTTLMDWYFVTKIVLTYCEKKIVLFIEKNFWNLRLKVENFQNFWDRLNQKNWTSFMDAPEDLLLSDFLNFRDYCWDAWQTKIVIYLPR